MRHSLLAASLLISLSSFAGVKAVKTNEFSVELPDGVTVKDTTDSTDFGPMTGKTWEAELGDNYLSLSYSDFPMKIFTALPAEKHLDNARNGSLSGSKAKLTKETKLSMKAGSFDAPGRDIESSTGEVLLNTRLIMVGPRLYTMVYGRPVSEKSIAPFTAMINSFKLGAYAPPANEPRVIDTKEFSLVMPSGTTDKPTNETTDFGPMTGISYEAEVGEAYLGMTYVDFPAKLIATQKPKQHLDNAANGSVKATKAKVITQTNIEVAAGKKKAPGIEMETETPEGITTKTRFFLVGNRLYTLVYARPKAETSVALYKAAVDSFVIK